MAIPEGIGGSVALGGSDADEAMPAVRPRSAGGMDLRDPWAGDMLST